MDNRDIPERNEYNGAKVKRTIEILLKKLEDNWEDLNDAIEQDDMDGNTINSSDIKQNIIKYINFKELLTIEDIKSKQLDGIGNVAVIYDGRPEIMIDMAIKALYTNNNMIFFPDSSMETTEFLYNLIKESLKETEYNAYIEIDDISNLYKHQEQYDLAVFIGEKYDYYKFKKTFEKEIIYSSYGSIQIYSDDNYFDNIIQKIDDYVFNNNLISAYYHDEDINDTINKINEIAITDTVAIFTRNKQKAIEFVKRVKARRIFVNTYPFKNYHFEFDEKKLLFNKKIITE